MSEEFTNVLEVWEESDHETNSEWDFFVIETNDWVSEGKYEYTDTIVKWKGVYYRIDESRSGSYWSDYHYDDPRATEVVPEEVVITKTIWKEVK